MSKLDDLIEEMRADGREDDAEELEKLRGSSLRQKAQHAEKLEKKVQELEASLAKAERGPKAQAAFRDYGIDLENLSKAEAKVLAAYDGELDEDAIASFVEEYGLPTVDGAESADEAEEQAPAERVAQVARRSSEGGGRSNKAPKISAADVAGWSMDRKVGFADAHPEEWEALKRGETVTGIAL